MHSEANIGEQRALGKELCCLNFGIVRSLCWVRSQELAMAFGSLCNC